MDSATAELSDQRQLLDQLTGSGKVAEAFQRICGAGFDSDSLKRDLLFLRKLGLQRSTRMYTEKDAKQLQKLADDVESAGHQLRKLNLPLLSPIYPGLGQDASTLLRIANSIRTAGATPKLTGFVTLTAAQWLPFLIRQVEEKTGKPHFADMATLIGAACDQPEFSEQELKMRVHRHSNRRK